MRAFLVIVAVVALVTPLLQAAQFFVDQKNASASNDNPGTAERPFLSINKAAELARAGDVVLVKPGVYREYVALRHSGKPGEPIKFQADSPGSVVVMGSDLVTQWDPLANEDALYSTPWQCVFAIDQVNGQPLEFHPPGHDLWGRAEQAFVDGKPLKPCLSLDELRKARAEHVSAVKAGKPSTVLQTPRPNLGEPFVGMYAADTRQAHRFYVWLADGGDPRQHKVELSTRDLVIGTNEFAFREGTEYVEVRGFIFRHGASFAQRPAVWLHGRKNLLENCVIESMAGAGVGVNGTMRGCVVRNNGYCGDGAYGDGFTDEECLWEGNCWKPFNRDWGAGGMKICVANGGMIRRCVFRRNGGPGLWFDIHDRNIFVTESVFWENEYAGLFIEISRNIQVVNNLFVRNGINVVGVLEQGGWSTAGIQLGESMNCVVGWNTCVGNLDGIAFRDVGPRVENTPDFGAIPYHITGDVVTSNIVADSRQYTFGLWSDASFFGWHPNDKEKFKTEEAWQAQAATIPSYTWDPAHMNLTIDKNIYFKSGVSGSGELLYGVPWRPKHTLFKELDAWTKLSGFDVHSRIADPKFEDAAHGNFRLRREKDAGAGWEMQCGWVNAPADIDAWMKDFLPAFR
jgi:hypothetical protein